MKAAVAILLCLSLSGCVLFKDALGGTANVPVGFEIAHLCIFNYPTHAAVVGFRFVEQEGPGRCGQVMLPVEQVMELSKAELAEYVFAQMLGGAFTPCKEAPDGHP